MRAPEHRQTATAASERTRERRKRPHQPAGIVSGAWVGVSIVASGPGDSGGSELAYGSRHRGERGRAREMEIPAANQPTQPVFFPDRTEVWKLTVKRPSLPTMAE